MPSIRRPVRRVSKKTKRVRAPVRKVRAAAAPRRAVAEKPIGTVTHFFPNIRVAVIRFRVAIKKGARVSFRGATTEFSQTLSSFQLNHKPLVRAPKGKSVGVKVAKRVREGDRVFLS